MVEQISDRVVRTNPGMTIREDETVHADGTPGIYGHIELADFILVIPEENDGLHLVEEYRHPIRHRSWSFPQGTVLRGRQAPSAVRGRAAGAPGRAGEGGGVSEPCLLNLGGNGRERGQRPL
ncbi:hypothetical protein [Streptosporangium vulgare]|uniref:NUDIX hydrolase n=1 Tax=Streptosporangium vulgare TaxID=46190 RepID=A0ABV5TQN3_9ACTN